MLHTRMDKGRKRIKCQQLYGGTAILSAATLREEHRAPGPTDRQILDAQFL